MNRIFLLSVFLILNGHLFSQEKEKYSEAIPFIEAWIEAQKDFENLPGISAIAVSDQEIIWKGAFGYANKEEMVEIEPKTLCSICSISKLFTSTAIMKLYDEGKLRLDDQIEDLLPWYDLNQQFQDSGPITVHALLTHSSGLPREANYPYWTFPEFQFPSTAEVKSALSKQKTLYPSETYFQYSNLAMTLLGEIVTEVSGQSYDDYISDNILSVLQLENTTTYMPKEKYGLQLAIGYGALNRKQQRQKVNFFEANGIAAAAGYASNVEDLAEFAKWQFRLLETGEKEILQASTLKNMHRVHWLDPDWNRKWGLGFSTYKGRRGEIWVGHGGSCPGYRSIIALNPKAKIGFAVMINAGATNPGKYYMGMNMLMEALKKEKIEESETELKDFSDYLGFYSLEPWWSELYIGINNGELVSLSLPADEPENSLTRYKHIEGDIFRRIRDDGELGEKMEFYRNDSGQVTHFMSHDNITIKLDR